LGRSRYKIYEPTHPHFVTFTILTNRDSVDIVIDSMKYLQEHDKLKIYAYVILKNHIHAVMQSDDLPKTIQKFKRHTAKYIIELLKKKNVKTILEQLAFYKKDHKKDSQHQLWQDGYQPKLILSDKMMREKIEYIHNNPIKRGYVDKDWHWRYSSARDYKGLKGLINIEKFV